jgi:hypothetical protein
MLTNDAANEREDDSLPADRIPSTLGFIITNYKASSPPKLIDPLRPKVSNAYKDRSTPAYKSSSFNQKAGSARWNKPSTTATTSYREPHRKTSTPPYPKGPCSGLQVVETFGTASMKKYRLQVPCLPAPKLPT